MTIADLKLILKQNGIPENATIYSDSGWECCETGIGDIFYSPKDNAIVLTQDNPEKDYVYKVDDKDWHDLSTNQVLKRLNFSLCPNCGHVLEYSLETSVSLVTSLSESVEIFRCNHCDYQESRKI